MLLQGILRRAVVRGLIPANPVSVVDKPGSRRRRSARSRSPPDHRRADPRASCGHATPRMISVAVPTPGCARTRHRAPAGATSRPHAPRPRDRRPSAPDDQAARTAGAGPRRVAARVGPTSGQRADLPDARRRRLEAARLAELAPARLPARGQAAGVTGDLRVYRLRGSFVSLLLWEGRSLTYVADQAGHSVATLAEHYAGVLRGARETSRASRPPRPSGTPASEAEVCAICAHPPDDRDRPHPRNPLQPTEWAMLGSNQRPPPCRDGALPAELIAREAVNVPGARGSG